MTIKEFIEKAIEGGWKYNKHRFRKLEVGALYGYTKVWLSDDRTCDSEVMTISVFLDPKAWQAVGKVDGWGICDGCKGEWSACSGCGGKLAWRHNMHRMIDALAEGKTLKQFIESL